jgi:hypothetical protein
MTDRGGFVVVAICALALLTACTTTSDNPPSAITPSPGTSPEVGRLASPPANHPQITLEAGDRGPSGVLSLGDQRQVGVLGSYCWQQQQAGGSTSGACLHMSSDMYFPQQYTAIESGTVRYVVGDQTTVRASLLRVTGGRGNPHPHVVQKLLLVEGASTVSAPPGRYTLKVDGRWPQGDAPIFFGLLVT